MSKSLNSLEKYTNAVATLKDHQAANKPVFDAHQKLVMSVIDADNELRDAVAEEKQGVSNGSHRVLYAPQSQTWADIEEIDKLIAAGTIPANVRNLIVKTQDRPPRITISEVNAAPIQ